VLEGLHFRVTLAAVELQQPQDFAMDWVCDVESCSE